MSRPTYIVAFCGVAFVVWGIAFLRQEPPRTQPLPPPTLQQRWDDATQYVIAFNPGPRIIQTVKISTEVPDVKPLEQKTPVAKPTQRKLVAVKRKPSTTCGRHGMRKVYIGKYKWRCKK